LIKKENNLMLVLILNGSPRKKGTVATLLKSISDVVSQRHEVEWIDVYDLKMKTCIACMKCRPDGECVQPEDDAHIIGRKIKDADGLIVGTPTHWGNMSAQLKLLFGRNVPVFMGEKPNGFPISRQKGKPAAIVTACTTPWPFNFIAAESRGAIRAVHEVLHYGGYKIIGKVVKPGTKKNPEIPQKLLDKAKSIGLRF
jgi:putative NADPH-quinone reductase